MVECVELHVLLVAREDHSDSTLFQGGRHLELVHSLLLVVGEKERFFQGLHRKHALGNTISFA